MWFDLAMEINRHALRVIRERSGITVSALAIAAGIRQAHLSNIEAGRRNASDTVIVALAKALDVPLQAIILGRSEGD